MKEETKCIIMIKVNRQVNKQMTIARRWKTRTRKQREEEKGRSEGKYTQK